MAALSAQTATLDTVQKHAKDLLVLARDPSPTARTALVSGLYDLSHESAELPAVERALAVDVVLEIIKRAPTGVRQQVSERLARDPQAPKVLVLALARDADVSVAYPVLIESSVLDESDLVEILRKSPPEHRCGTLQRESLSEAVASVAVQTGDPQVMRWLVENPGANISHSDMELIVQAARVEPELQKPLVNRSDLPADLATKMEAFLPDDLRQQIVDRHRVDTGALDQARANAETAAAAAAEAERRAMALALEHRQAGTLDVELLMQTIRAGKLVEFEAFFARYARISLSAARRILAAQSGEGMAVTLKAPGVNKGIFSKIFMLNRQARDANTEVSAALARASEVFDRLQNADAASRLAALRAAHPEDSAP
jgi:uncharacterized protein (DUF2336 family)